MAAKSEFVKLVDIIEECAGDDGFVNAGIDLAQERFLDADVCVIVDLVDV